MNINVKASQITLDPPLSAYLDKRLGALRKLVTADDGEVQAYVELAKTTNHHRAGDVFRAEINFKSLGKSFFAQGESQSIKSAIDLMRDEVLEEVRSWKGKRESLLKRGGAKVKAMFRAAFMRKEMALAKDWIEEEADKEIGKN